MDESNNFSSFFRYIKPIVIMFPNASKLSLCVQPCKKYNFTQVSVSSDE